MIEIWKPVKGYEGKYKISNFGKVVSLSREKFCGHKDSKPQITKERVLLTRIDHLGYVRVGIADGEKRRHMLLHRLLAEAFVSNPNGFKEVNHIDGNKTNNSIGNLEWCSRSENIKHAFNTGLMKARKGESNNKSKITEDDVRAIRKMRSETNKTLHQIGEEFGITYSAVYYIVKNKTWKEVI